MPEGISLEYIGRRLDDLQGEATNNRLVADVIMKQMKSLQSEFDAQRSRLDLMSYRIDRIDGRLGGIETDVSNIHGRLGGIETNVSNIHDRLTTMEALLTAILDKGS